MSNPEGGFESFPSLYADGLQTGEFSEWKTPFLLDRYNEYTQFLQRPDLMPRAQTEAARILLHLTFELDYRAGVYSGTPVEATL